MIWSRLKSFKCPSCNKVLTDNTAKNGKYICLNCHFTIGKDKFDSIVSSPPKRYVEPDRSGWDINSNNDSDHDERDN